jgi:hypothetical protein
MLMFRLKQNEQKNGMERNAMRRHEPNRSTMREDALYEKEQRAITQVRTIKANSSPWHRYHQPATLNHQRQTRERYRCFCLL